MRPAGDSTETLWRSSARSHSAPGYRDVTDILRRYQTSGMMLNGTQSKFATSACHASRTWHRFPRSQPRISFAMVYGTQSLSPPSNASNSCRSSRVLIRKSIRLLALVRGAFVTGSSGAGASGSRKYRSAVVSNTGINGSHRDHAISAVRVRGRQWSSIRCLRQHAAVLRLRRVARRPVPRIQ